MSRPIILPDGTKCYSAPTCRKHYPKPHTDRNGTSTVNYVKLSKTLAYILRHNPEKIGITLQPQGWVNIKLLVEKINTYQLLTSTITVNDVLYVAHIDNKKRYTIQGENIRAAQGHSAEVNLNLTPMTPPVFLYHGTSTTTAPIVLKEGLKPMSRQHVHLSSDLETALTVGARHGKPQILIVNAALAHKEGVKFYKADNGVWLTDYLPTKYIRSDV